MNKPVLCLLISFQLFCVMFTVFGQAESLKPEAALPITSPTAGWPDELSSEVEVSSGYMQKRDPFIPLIDKEGNLRKDFKKPVIIGNLAPHVNLMGISKVKNVFYAIVDGKWVMEGDMLGDLIIDKIESDKITLRFGEKKFEVKLHMEKK